MDTQKTTRTFLKDRDRRNNKFEDSRSVSESLLRRQRGAALNSRRKQKLLEIQKENNGSSEYSAPIIFTEEEFRLALTGAVQAVAGSIGQTEHYRHVRYLRYLLTDSEDPPFTLIHQLKVVPIFLSELKSPIKEIQLDALWGLAFVADNDMATARQVLAQASDIARFLSRSSGFDTAELAAWLFHSMSLALTSDDEIVNIDVASLLADLFFACGDPSITWDSHVVDAGATAAWALCSLISRSPSTVNRLKGYPKFSLQLSNQLSSQDVRILTEAAWLVTYLVASDDEHLMTLIEANVVFQLVKVLNLTLYGEASDVHTVYSLLTPVLRSIGNIAAGLSTDQVIELISYKEGIMLTCIAECLGREHRGIQREACKTLSNIAASCGQSMVEALIKTSVLSKVVQFVAHAAFDIKREASFVLANVCFNGDVPNTDFLEYILGMEKGLMAGIVSLLRGMDADTVKLGLDFTELILANVEYGPQRIEEVDGIEALETIQFGDIPSDLQERAYNLVDEYFGEDYV